MADINLTDIFSTVGYHLSNLIGEVRGKRDQEYRAMEGALIKDPSLGDVPKFRSVMKHHGWQDQDFEVLKAHKAVSNIAELLKTVDQTTQRPQAQPGGPVMGSMGGVAGGAVANMSPAPSAKIALPAASIPQAPAPPEAPPQSRAQALAGRLPSGSALTVKEPGASLTLRGAGGAAKATGFAALQEQRQAAVLRGDYRGAAELDARIKVLTTPPAEAAAARTTATEQAKLEPALVEQKLNAKERENLRKIAPAPTLKALRTKDGKDVPAGSLTNEQVLAMTKSGDLVPKQNVQDAFLSTASRLLFGTDLFGGSGAAAGGAAPQPAASGINWDDDPTVTVKPAH